jgi:hypothetical protein
MLKWGGVVVKDLISNLGFRDQFSKMTWVVMNGGMLIEYSLLT